MKLSLILALCVLVCCPSLSLAKQSAYHASPQEKTSPHKPKKKIIIDTDMGWDDTLSTLYLMKRPDIEIIGMSVTGCGETNLRWGRVIARSLMDLGDRAHVPVSAGTSTPMKFDHIFPQNFRNDMNDLMGLLGTINPTIDVKLDPRPAWKLLSDLLNTTKEPVTILCLGGFTNLAMMLKEYPDTKIDMIKNVYAMAGAIFVDGNVALLNNARKSWDQGPVYGQNYRAEWNIFVDPLAAKTVFESKIPLTLIPLDACDYVLLSPKVVNTIKGNDSISQLAKNILTEKVGPHKEGIPVPIFDPLATMVMAHGLKNYEYVSVYLDVDIQESEEHDTCGRLIHVDNGSRKIRVIQGVSNYLFAKDFAAVLNNN
ncbi:nucleoside hydrolase [Desulfovibrio inopinatus]|uniref:nucleoside hydrolase n=1 Tax=Desulfovibrio inopinatus TaxID=102109 RepID=UPI000416193C|nr:nucleoside hydrolase [Desulfovibrio inopinatus]